MAQLPSYILEQGKRDSRLRIRFVEVRQVRIVKPLSSSILIVLASLALVACGRSIGAPFDMAAANTLTPGVSTLDDAVAKLGTTTHRVGSARGTVAHWHYLRDRSGGATESASVTIMFDRNGRMVDILQRLEERPTAEN